MSQHIRKPDRPDKYKSFELSKEAEIVKRLADGTMKVAREYGISHTTVSTWKKQADKIIQDAGKSTPKRKRLRWSPHIEVEQSLILWLREMHSLDVPPPITYMMLHLKAELYVSIRPILSNFCNKMADQATDITFV